MSELIKNLLRQTHLLMIGPDGREYVENPEAIEHFAELIVQECIKSVKKDMYSGHTHSDFSTGYDAALENAISDIKEKFGINE